MKKLQITNNPIFLTTVICLTTIILSCGSPEKKSASGSKNAKQDVSTEQLDFATKLLKEVPDSSISNVKVEKLYDMHCMLCHGRLGNANINGAKDLTQSTVAIEDKIAQIYFGKGLMQPYKSILSEPEIIALARFTETLK